MADLPPPDLEKANAFTDMMLDYARDNNIDISTAFCAAEVYLGHLISETGVIGHNVKSSARAIKHAAEEMYRMRGPDGPRLTH